MFTISIHEKKNSISINYAVTMKRNFGCISSFFRLFFSFFHFSLLLSLSSSSVSIVVFLVPSSIFFGAVFERKSLFISSCLPYLYTLIVYTRRQVFFIVERRWKKIYLLYTKFLLYFTFRCFFSLVSEREIWKHNFFVLCVRNSALDGLRDSSLSSFFQLYVGKKKFLYYVFSSLFSTMKHSHENVKRFRNIFYLFTSSVFLSGSLVYKHINMLNPIHIIFLFLKDIYFCLFIYLWIFFYISSSYNILLLWENSAFLSIDEKFL